MLLISYISISPRDRRVQDRPTPHNQTVNARGIQQESTKAQILRYMGCGNGPKIPKRLGNNDKLSLKDLTNKFAILMDLVSACRGSELHKLNPALMTYKTDEVIFHITGLTKSKRPSKPHISVIFQKYAEDPQLDVIESNRTYITMPKNYRLAENHKQSLFLSYKAPFKRVATSSIAWWLKLVIAEAEVNTSVFKAHSTRATYTSKAQMQGLSTARIIERANWSKSPHSSGFTRKT